MDRVAEGVLGSEAAGPIFEPTTLHLRYALVFSAVQSDRTRRSCAGGLTSSRRPVATSWRTLQIGMKAGPGYAPGRRTTAPAKIRPYGSVETRRL